MSTPFASRLRTAAAVAILTAAIPVAAQPAPAPTPAASPSVGGSDSRETRSELNDVLRRCPPQLGAVLKLDPKLIGEPAYLAPYPELAAFVAQHPEVARTPDFFLANVSIPSDESAPSYSASVAMDILSGLLAFCIFLVVTGTLAWLVKTLIAQRRWNRLSRVQTEVHTKLLDRLASSEELLGYIQSSAGRRFLESAPIPVEDAKPSLGAPVARILGSIQLGVIIGAAGIGMQVISRGLPADVSRAVFAVGVFALCLGAGFVAAAIVSYFVSRRLGLWPSPGAVQSRDVEA